MKKTYQQPDIWVEELEMDCHVLAESPIFTKKELTRVVGYDEFSANIGIRYGGGGTGPARAEEIVIWDDDGDDASSWDNL